MQTWSIYKAFPQSVRNQRFFQTPEEIFQAATDNMDVVYVSLMQAVDTTKYKMPCATTSLVYVQ